MKDKRYKCGGAGCAGCDNVMPNGSCAYSYEYECDKLNCPVLCGYQYPKGKEVCRKCYFVPKEGEV